MGFSLTQQFERLLLDDVLYCFTADPLAEMGEIILLFPHKTKFSYYALTIPEDLRNGYIDASEVKEFVETAIGIKCSGQYLPSSVPKMYEISVNRLMMRTISDTIPNLEEQFNEHQIESLRSIE